MFVKKNFLVTILEPNLTPNLNVRFLEHKTKFFFWHIIVLILERKGSSIRTFKKRF